IHGGYRRLHGRAECRGESLPGAEQPRHRSRQRPAGSDRGLSRAGRRMADPRRQRFRAQGDARRDGAPNQLGHLAVARPAAAARAGTSRPGRSGTAGAAAGMVRWMRMRWQRALATPFAIVAIGMTTGCKSATETAPPPPAVTVARPVTRSVADYLDF